MREATAFALFLAVMMSLVAISQLDSLAATLIVVTSGPLNAFIAAWPFLMAGIAVIIVVAFAVSAVSRR